MVSLRVQYRVALFENILCALGYARYYHEMSFSQKLYLRKLYTSALVISNLAVTLGTVDRSMY